MFTYQQDKCAECLPCSIATLKALTQDHLTREKIDDVRRLMACGRIKEARDKKSSLPALMFQAREVMVSEGTAKYNKGRLGRWRDQAHVILSGLVMCDFDHVEEPKMKFDEWLLTNGNLFEDEGIVMVFITPSGKGLKVVFKARMEWGNLVDNQQQMAKVLGLTVKIDKGCKDSARWSFIPKWEDILYMNEEELFGYDNPLYDEKFGARYREGLSQGTIDFGEDHAGKLDKGTGVKREGVQTTPPDGTPPTSGGEENSTDDLSSYHGVAYKDIVAKWNELKGGRPAPGDRHQRMLEMSGELRRIVDNKPALVLRLMQQADFYEDFVKEGRVKELEQMAEDVCKYRPRGAMSQELSQTLDFFGIKHQQQDTTGITLPYDDWAARLAELPLGCYTPAIAHIDNPLVKPGGVISASGMYTALLTRCNYQNWKGDMQRLNSLVLVEGPPATGKSLAKIQDDHIMLAMRESDKPARDAEKAYKKEKNARNTSSKAQKGEALTEPGGIIRYNVVKVSNNRFYHHAENNVEQGYDGEPWYLHQYMFSTELLSLVNAKGGFQEKRDIMLQAFHNERNGVDYANTDSVNSSLPMMFSGVFTCTRTSLQQFINARNIGDGMSTRMTPWVMPEDDYHTDEFRASRRDRQPLSDMEMWGARFDALKCEIGGVEPLVRHVYDLCAALGEEARINNDRVLNLERKRLQDKVLAVCIPQVISTQADWDAFAKTGVCKIEQHHLDFATLMLEIINRCEDALFGQLLQDMYDNEDRGAQLRRVYDKTAKFFAELPEEFTTQDVMRIWGYKNPQSANNRISELMRKQHVERKEKGVYRKIVSSI